jgi:hypothetical protein
VATKLQIARARARVALARHTGTVRSSRLIAVAALEFSEADDVPDNEGLHFLDAAVGPFYDPRGLRKWLRYSRAELALLEESRDILFVTTSDGYSLYPAFQFDAHGRPLLKLHELLEGPDPDRDDAWGDAVWLNDAAEDLDGLTPAQALRTSRAEDAIRLAQRAGGFLRG